MADWNTCKKCGKAIDWRYDECYSCEPVDDKPKIKEDKNMDIKGLKEKINEYETISYQINSVKKAMNTEQCYKINVKGKVTSFTVSSDANELGAVNRDFVKTINDATYAYLTILNNRQNELKKELNID